MIEIAGYLIAGYLSAGFFFAAKWKYFDKFENPLIPDAITWIFLYPVVLWHQGY